VHVTLVPFIGPSGEQKTKPTQHSSPSCAAAASSPTHRAAAPTGPIPLAVSGEDLRSSAYVPERGISLGHRTPTRSTRSRTCSTTRASTTTFAPCCPQSHYEPTSPRWQGLVDRVRAADFASATRRGK
jgi:hypothetical protein